MRLAISFCLFCCEHFLPRLNFWTTHTRAHSLRERPRPDVHLTKIALRHRIPLLRRLGPPVNRLGIILGAAKAGCMIYGP
jgi:hypothetical protein